MGISTFYEERVLPRLVDAMCVNQEMERWRARAAAGLRGTVVELGFGSGPNIGIYPHDVVRVFAVEPNAVARATASRRLERLRADGGPDSVPIVEHVGLDGQSIPLPDDSCDGAFCTFTLCTIPDLDSALAEVHRVLRPGGRFHFLEHGVAPDETVRRWQVRLEPVQRRLAGGCHLTRDLPAAVSDAGFEIDSIDQRYARGPRPWTWFSTVTSHAV